MILSDLIETDAGFAGQIIDVLGDIAAHPHCFAVSPHGLDRVEFRRVCRKATYRCPFVSGEHCPHCGRSVDRQAVPDKYHAAAHPPEQCPHESREGRPVDVVLVQPKELPHTSSLPPAAARRDRERSGGADLLPSPSGDLENRRLAYRAPSRSPARLGREPRFVHENQRGAASSRFFSRRGNSTSTNRLMACSSRSFARTIGFWTDRPSRRTNLLRWSS